ncbi:arginyl-trna synthetase [Fusarium albosuccineum]|uniref:arginine--tRNA ligase n=1 Tax=Fusarium albosuccineum TaxID=1237068 RepID=A0A8H4LG88_9HYPO|nr:arginyl-trna synthetase [Fusarium albosuccineum]
MQRGLDSIVNWTPLQPLPPSAVRLRMLSQPLRAPGEDSSISQHSDPAPNGCLDARRPSASSSTPRALVPNTANAKKAGNMKLRPLHPPGFPSIPFHQGARWSGSGYVSALTRAPTVASPDAPTATLSDSTYDPPAAFQNPLLLKIKFGVQWDTSVFANPMFPIPRNLLPQARRNQGAQDEDQVVEQGRSLLATLGRALTFDRDDWQKQFCERKGILVADENQPRLALLAALAALAGFGPLENEIESVMMPNDPTRLWERHVFRIESLLKGASFILDDAIPAEPGTAMIKGAPQPTQPTIWVWDRNCFPDSPRSRRDLGRIFDGREFYDLLKKDVEGLRELLANYVTRSPKSYFKLRQSKEWNQPFIFSINLPFYAPSTLDMPEDRTITERKRSVPLRRRHSLRFLYPNEDLDPESDDEESSLPTPTYLHDVVCSIMLTGPSEEYWTCFFLNEDLFEESDKQRLQTEEILDEDGGGKLDPFTQVVDTAASDFPRVFGLHVLVTVLTGAYEHQCTIQDCFQQSLNLFTIDSPNDPTQISSEDVSKWINEFMSLLGRVIDRNMNCVDKLKEFLDENVGLGDEGRPTGRLFRGLQNDTLAMKYLHELAEVHKNLRDVTQQLSRLRSQCGDFSRVRKRRRDEEVHNQASEAQKLQNIFKQMTTIQIVLNILNLIAQLFSGRVDPSDKTMWTLFITLARPDLPNTIQIIVAMATTCSVSGIESLLGKAGLDTPMPEFPGANTVTNPQDIFRVYLADTLQKLVDCDRLVAYEAIQPSNVTGGGDLVIVSPRLRLKDVKPKDLVSDLAHKVRSLNMHRNTFNATDRLHGIHLRVFSSPNTLSRLLLPYIHDRSASYGYDSSLGLADPASPDGPRKKVVVEFSSPNMEREFQVSHLRSTLIGSYVANIHARMGWDVVKMNYLGDWGKQIGLLAAGWQRFGSEEEFAKQPLYHLLEVNHKIQELFKPEQDESKAAKADGKDVTEIESRGLYAERDVFFKKMEDKDPEAIALWQRFRDAMVKEYAASYARLGVTFDEYSGESQVTAESIAEVEQALKDKGIYEEEDGSWRIDFAKHDAKGLSTAVLRFRNGTTSYLLRDIAAVLDRYKAHSFDKMIYVVAMEQEMHFHRVTKSFELMGRQDLAERIQHLAFAKIHGLPKQFKDARLLSDYLEGCHALMQASLDDGEEGEGEEEEIFVDKTEKSVDLLGLSGLFIQDHSHKRTTSYTGDPKKMAPLSGETGAAIQNCYARLSSKLSPESTSFDYSALDYAALEVEDHAELLRIMAQYPDAAHASFKTLEPSLIILYLLRLVDQIMVTLDEDDERDWTGKDDANQARMALYENARQVFENALRALGVSPYSA